MIGREENTMKITFWDVSQAARLTNLLSGMMVLKLSVSFFTFLNSLL
jgi:hypothetical protein